MGSNGAHIEEQGYALLIAASPAGRHRVMAAAEALPMLAALPPAALIGTATGSVVQLADPADPNTVLTHLRTAAAHRGPLLVYVAGELMLDARQRLPHLALARSTSSRAVRYTGLPWHWLTSELAQRPADRTTVLVDLVADESFWRQTEEHQLDAGLAMFGAVAPPPPRRSTVSPAYSRALAAVLRSTPDRPSAQQLHLHAAAQAGLDGDREQLLGGRPERDPGPPRPTGTPPPPAHPPTATAAAAPVQVDQHAEIYAAAQAGRHAEAMAIAVAWEEAALRAGGPQSADAIHWVEVRADLARLAGDHSRACGLWLQAAAARLQTGQDPASAPVFAAVDRAHHCWHHVIGRPDARALGYELLDLREQTPGRNPGALADIRTRLAALNQPADTPS